MWSRDLMMSPSFLPSTTPKPRCARQHNAASLSFYSYCCRRTDISSSAAAFIQSPLKLKDTRLQSYFLRAHKTQKHTRNTKKQKIGSNLYLQDAILRVPCFRYKHRNFTPGAVLSESMKTEKPRNSADLEEKKNINKMPAS